MIAKDSAAPATDPADGFARLRAAIAGCIGIAHHLRGRIRLRLERGADGLAAPAAADIKRFQALLEGMAGVHSLRVNLLARSCTVEYDPAVIPFEAWADFLAGRSSAAAAALEAPLRQTYQEAVDGRA